MALPLQSIAGKDRDISRSLTPRLEGIAETDLGWQKTNVSRFPAVIL